MNSAQNLKAGTRNGEHFALTISTGDERRAKALAAARGLLVEDACALSRWECDVLVWCERAQLEAWEQADPERRTLAWWAPISVTT